MKMVFSALLVIVAGVYFHGMPFLGVAEEGHPRGIGKGALERADRGLRISEVFVHPKVFNPSLGEKVTVRFKVSRPSKARIRVLDSELNLVRDLSGGIWQEIHDVVWDGKDFGGKVVPNEAYTFTIEAVDRSRGAAFYDPFARFDVEDTTALKVAYVEGRRVVSYHLPRDARVLIRAGIPRGPLLKTILYWQPRQAGYHEEPWDGRDESGALYLPQKGDYKLSAEAMPLFENSVIAVGNPNVDLDRYKREPGVIRSSSKDHLSLGHGPWAVQFDPKKLVQRGPIPKFRIDLPEQTLRTESGHFRVHGKVPIKVTLDEKVLNEVTEERYEVILYVDFQFVSEVEEGYSPSTLLWDTKEVGSGEHILTVNVRTLTGQVSSASLRVWVD